MDVERQGFEDIASNASDHVYDLNSGIRRLARLCSRENAATGLTEVVAMVTSKCSTTGRIVESLQEFESADLSVSQRQQLNQIVGEFGHLAKELAELQRRATVLLRKAANEAAQEPANHSSSEATEHTPLIQVLDQLDQGSVNLHTQLLEERELEIVEIQRGMTEINAIFSDLGTLIQEQGAQLDTVEENVTDVATQTDNAQRELVRADNYQKSRGKWSCYLLLVLLVITIIVALSFIH